MAVAGATLLIASILLPQTIATWPSGTIGIEPGTQNSTRLFHFGDLPESFVRRGLPAVGIGLASLAACFGLLRARRRWLIGFLAATGTLAVLLIIGFVGGVLVRNGPDLPASGAYLGVMGGSLLITGAFSATKVIRAQKRAPVRTLPPRRQVLSGVILAGVVLFVVGHLTPFLLIHSERQLSATLVNVSAPWKYEGWKAVLPGGVATMASVATLHLLSKHATGATVGFLCAAGLVATLIFLSTLGSILLDAPFWTPGLGTYVGLLGGLIMLGGAFSAQRWLRLP